MPPDTNADVLRRHGLMVLADWAENALIAPRYARQSQYWASVLSEPEIPEFAEWPMEGARGLEFDIDDEADAARGRRALASGLVLCRSRLGGGKEKNFLGLGRSNRGAIKNLS